VTRPKKNWLEWTVFWASLALVASVAVFLAVLAVRDSGTQPALEVSLGAPEQVPTGYAVRVDVRNAGDVAAENVVVEVTDESGRERGELTLAFVPGGSRRHGWVTFSRPPSVERLRARILGYEKP
jgi:uncharacterized protein (TIGR02588 family)